MQHKRKVILDEAEREGGDQEADVPDVACRHTLLTTRIRQVQPSSSYSYRRDVCSHITSFMVPICAAKKRIMNSGSVDCGVVGCKRRERHCIRRKRGLMEWKSLEEEEEKEEEEEEKGDYVITAHAKCLVEQYRFRLNI